jgi:hypothetical protein
VKTETTNRFSVERTKTMNPRLPIALPLKVRAKNHQQALDTKDSFRDGNITYFPKLTQYFLQGRSDRAIPSEFELLSSPFISWPDSSALPWVVVALPLALPFSGIRRDTIPNLGL